jgi:hypothetical protein
MIISTKPVSEKAPLSILKSRELDSNICVFPLPLQGGISAAPDGFVLRLIVVDGKIELREQVNLFQSSLLSRLWIPNGTKEISGNDCFNSNGLHVRSIVFENPSRLSKIERYTF